MNANLIPQPVGDRAEIDKTLKTLFAPDAVVEIRVIHKNRKRTDAGYFDGAHRSDLISAAIKANKAGVNVYVTLNPIDSQLLGRFHNRLQEYARATATDNDVIRRSWLLIDIDPARPTDTAATDEQLQLAKAQALNVYKFLQKAGWPRPVCGESGNGVHLLYPVDLSNDNETTDLIKSILNTLADRFDTEAVKIDRAVFNAARITKLYGTVSTKGDHNEQTPWRLSRITSAPPNLIKVTEAQLRAINPPAVKTVASASSSKFNLDEFLVRLDIPFQKDRHDGRDRYKLDHCPFNTDHGKGDAALFRSDEGVLGFKCMHDSCTDKGWRDVRALVDGSSNGQPGENLTDAGNGKRLIRHFGEDLRFVPEAGKWLMYSNGRWEWDNDGGINRLAKETTRIMLDEGKNNTDDDQRQRLIKHALASENCSRLKAMIDLAATEQEAVLHQSELDRNRDLLSIANGVLNLKNSEFRLGKREDYLTKKSNVVLTKSINTCPVWLRFLEKVMGGVPELIKYLQRAMGYSLTGHTSEQCLFFLYGTGANGKTTFLTVMQELMGDYCMAIDPETIMLNSNSGGATPELARLMGARVVISNEIEEGKRLAENRIKQMTGGDTMIARHLYREPFEFRPEFKIFMAGNHKPAIKGTDHAIWRRIHLVPFTVTIPEEEKDPQLTEKLKAELPGILQWTVKGAKEWHRQGLNPPNQVKAAVADYRDEMDTLGHWLEERCTFDSKCKTESSTLYQSYHAWCGVNGHFPQSQTRLGTALGDRGLKKTKVGKISWEGIGLKTLQMQVGQ